MQSQNSASTYMNSFESTSIHEHFQNRTSFIDYLSSGDRFCFKTRDFIVRFVDSLGKGVRLLLCEIIIVRAHSPHGRSSFEFRQRRSASPTNAEVPALFPHDLLGYTGQNRKPPYRWSLMRFAESVLHSLLLSLMHLAARTKELLMGGHGGHVEAP